MSRRVAPAAASRAGSEGVPAASLHIRGDADDSITSQDVAVESGLHFLHVTALSREEPEPKQPATKKTLA